MLLKPFEAGRYDDESIVVANPVNGKQELFSDREFAIVKFLKQNESQSLLALLMPNIGIAKKTHVDQCLKVLSKLKRMQIADYFSITGRKPASGTDTLDMEPKKEKIELTSLNTLATLAYGVACRVLAPIGPTGLLALVVTLAALAFLLFPFQAIAPMLADSSPSYMFFLFTAWLAGSAAFCFRALVQAAFLHGFKREMAHPVVALYFPLIAFAGDRRGVNLLGYKARAQLAILGIISPLALGGIVALLCAFHLLPVMQGLAAFSACAAAALVLACPFLQFDGAELLQALLFREQLELKVSTQLREVFTSRIRPSRELGIALVASLVWLFAWLDCMKSFWDSLASRIAQDLSGATFSEMGGSVVMIIAIFMLALMPAAVVLLHHLRLSARRRRRRLVLDKGNVKDSLTFEERIAALEKIPLFAYLNDQERLALLNEMQPAFYKHGAFLVHQGELGREFFVLVKGHANAMYTDVKGKGMLLADLREGDAFGEIALIDDVPRTASIVSDGGCISLVLRKEGFDRFAESLGSADRVKAMIRLTSFFRRHPLFSKLSPRDQAQLIDSFRFQTITSGERIPDGDENFHVIYSGSVRVDTGGADGETTLESDDCFGYSNPLNASFIALEGTGLLTVAKNEFHNLIWEKLVEKPELFV